MTRQCQWRLSALPRETVKKFCFQEYFGFLSRLVRPPSHRFCALDYRRRTHSGSKMAQYGEDAIISKCDSGFNAELLGWNNMIEKKKFCKNTLVTYYY